MPKLLIVIIPAFLNFIHPWCNPKSEGKTYHQLAINSVDTIVKFSVEDVFKLKHADDAQISPNGLNIAYIRVEADIDIDGSKESIWLYNIKSGKDIKLIPGSSAQPRWSPDGKQIAFSAADKSGNDQIFIYTLNSGKITQVSNINNGPQNLSWSPKGDKLAFNMFVSEPDTLTIGYGKTLIKPENANWAQPLNVITGINYQADGSGFLKQGHSQLFVVSVADGSIQQLTSGPFNNGNLVKWMPDGKSVLLSSNHNPKWELAPGTSNIFKISIKNGAIIQLTNRKGRDDNPVISPDGKLVAFIGFDDNHRSIIYNKLYVMNEDGSDQHILSTSLDREIFQPVWAADGNLYCTYAESGKTRIGKFSLSGKMTKLVDDIEDSYSISNNSTLAYSVSEICHPADLTITNVFGVINRLTNLNADLLNKRNLGKLRRLQVKSSFDGHALSTWVLLPPNFNSSDKYPVILCIHGGPYGSFGPQWDDEFQLYAAAGYVVVFGNYRGSISEDYSFADQINYDFPSEADFDDLMSMVDATIGQGIADPRRLFVTGGSAGGLLTAFLVGKTDRFKAAVAQKPVIDWIADFANDQFASAYENYGGMPWDNHEDYWKHSPLSLVGKINTPTMCIVGDQDRRTPLLESEEFYNALLIKGIPAALVIVPGASHESLESKLSQRIAQTNTTLGWFAKFGGIRN